ncbi:hypothetical protein FNF27_06968 [Cafeteria roenbergensis]|uniref:Helicase C-terminal domain-containing protein n=1 Tax=Cafeteria roenbergensis TaxID=33653 RepID=A0A5A8E046_CAFRO|nr:hypothetical protein FNF27_06968 [Cafeteria roenbergensis]
MLDVLETWLNVHGWAYLRLDGATPVSARQQMMDRFNGDDSIPVFILSTRAGGLGINLTGASTVVFYDSDWNPAMDAQAQDRAHRIGQTREVVVYRLVTAGSVEEAILHKAAQKKRLVGLSIDRGQFGGREARSAETGSATATSTATATAVASAGGAGGGSAANAGSSVDETAAEPTAASSIMGRSELASLLGVDPGSATDADVDDTVTADALAVAEDDEDAAAGRAAAAEAAAELGEFGDVEQPSTAPHPKARAVSSAGRGATAASKSTRFRETASTSRRSGPSQSPTGTEASYTPGAGSGDDDADGGDVGGGAGATAGDGGDADDSDHDDDGGDDDGDDGDDDGDDGDDDDDDDDATAAAAAAAAAAAEAEAESRLDRLLTEAPDDDDFDEACWLCRFNGRKRSRKLLRGRQSCGWVRRHRLNG